MAAGINPLYQQCQHRIYAQHFMAPVLTTTVPAYNASRYLSIILYKLLPSDPENLQVYNGCGYINCFFFNVPMSKSGSPD
jgi:hypothetical protein